MKSIDELKSERHHQGHAQQHKRQHRAGMDGGEVRTQADSGIDHSHQQHRTEDCDSQFPGRLIGEFLIEYRSCGSHRSPPYGECSWALECAPGPRDRNYTASVLQEDEFAQTPRAVTVRVNKARRVWLEWSGYQEQRLNAWLTRAVCLALCLGTTTVETLDASPAAAQPAVTISPGELDFGDRPVGTDGPPATVTLTNHAVTVLAPSGILISGVDFSETNTCGSPLSPGASCAVEVKFKPAISGPRLGTLVITASDPASPHRIALAGTGR